MKSSFPKSNKGHSKKRKEKGLTLPVPSSHIVVWKRALHICKYAHIYIFMKISLQKHDLQIWHSHCKLDFWIGAYCVFGKRALLISLAAKETEGWGNDLG